MGTPKRTRISAQISDSTRELMERYVRRAGVKMGHLIDQALLHHLSALEELPAEYIVRPRLVVSRATGADLLGSARSKEPTPALRDLMRDGE